MTVTVLIIIAILVIIGFRNNPVEPKPKGKYEPSRDYRRQSYQNIDAFLKQCYNENTLEFNWHVFNHDDNGVWDDEASQNYLNSQMKSIGIARRQGMYELLIHGLYNPEMLQAMLREKIAVIQNLTEPRFGACPQYVKQFQEDLIRLASGKTPCTRQNIQRVMDRYNAGSASSR